ncbi:glycosyltransferase [Flavisolibacter nicotianae]|uniref:glycosyltransferase n=1 Tax=Flavisolibacter nicotianae TaxID=2364882 RepID=UPI0013C4FBB6|nr:glycosyltransferase [Flavisolibacter nicotianae]
MDQDDLSPKILLAPLDWGLGHATRCIPLIRELLRQQCAVTLAADGKSKRLLQQEFPQLPFLDLPGYDIEYAATAWGLALKIVAQIPKLLAAVKQEQAWLESLVAAQPFDAVISDNRYGLNHASIRSVLITHQLRIKAPLTLAEDLLQETAYQYINRFSECWVPDAEGENNLAGELSHPLTKPSIPLYYTGPLSRFGQNKAEEKPGQLLVLLSGPEPQRTLLEESLLNDLQEYTRPVVLVRGLPGETAPVAVPENITVYNHLPAAELEQTIREASLVIGRCGYSTVMDLAALQKRSILIPTPGQTEQEYLARHLMQKNFAFCVEQKKFRLKHALELVERFPFKPFETTNNESLQRIVGRFVSSLKKTETPRE